MPKPINRQIVLVSRPRGLPDSTIFSMQEAPIPKPQEGEVLVKSLYLTVDPYMRGRMNDAPSYIEPFALDEPPTGGVVGVVVESKSPLFKEGDYVLGFLSWTDYCVAKASSLLKLDDKMAPITTALGILGMPGMTAYFGLLDIGKPKSGETVVVSGAAGAVGMAVGQIAKILGCRVVGIAGKQEKISYLTQELGFDAGINYTSEHFEEELHDACPNGIDVYFDNVGGDVSDAATKLMNKYGRIVLCGQISVYNLEKPGMGPRLDWILLTRSILKKGFIVTDYMDRYPEGIAQMSQWIKEGKIKYRENIIEGLENTPRAFLGLFKGENIGKQLVKVSR